jgi:hypothetical protein
MVTIYFVDTLWIDSSVLKGLKKYFKKIFDTNCMERQMGENVPYTSYLSQKQHTVVSSKYAIFATI